MNQQFIGSRAIGRDGLVFNFMKSEILDQVLPSRIHSIDFISNYFTREDSLCELPPIIVNHIGYVRKINFSRQTSFKDFNQLDLFTNLEEFKISDTRLPAENVIRILSSNKHLKSIEYSNPLCDSSTLDVQLFLASIISLPNLRHVNLSGVKFINDEIVAKLLINLPYLSDLVVRYCTNVSDIAFAGIEQHKHIKIVDITGCKITNPGIILKNQNIRKLSYEDSDFENVYLDLGTIVSKVIELSFSLSTNISTNVLRSIADSCPDVEILRLETSTYKSDGLKQFLNSSINKLTSLKELYLNGTKLDDGNIKEILLEKLQILSLEFNNITDSSIDKIKQFTQLTDIRLGRTNITHKGIADLLAHYHSIGKVIENLALNSLKITGEQILSIPHWSQVQRLNLSKNKVNNDAFLFLIKLLNIIELNCSDNMITNEAVHPHIYSNRTLRKLNLSSNRNISARTKSSIVMKCPNISELTL
ncbi:predicted protein [Naegleria gruberi]|uniref:Predicted protein n=1 Tax=Naegleria gruberi TaxID=5762 RepID=D2V219_NAEGR|nr:uncharacterized protein NAEGRDRAFT_46060 [Naegleria gruberi]EFC48826.1 predicted protein [Naegleria gruberi]|eukprot:XP_002681570.1 predicted protein [Naegleria gruberi strain NEG-M]